MQTPSPAYRLCRFSGIIWGQATSVVYCGLQYFLGRAIALTHQDTGMLSLASAAYLVVADPVSRAVFAGAWPWAILKHYCTGEACPCNNGAGPWATLSYLYWSGGLPLQVRPWGSGSSHKPRSGIALERLAPAIRYPTFGSRGTLLRAQLMESRLDSQALLMAGGLGGAQVLTLQSASDILIMATLDWSLP